MPLSGQPRLRLGLSLLALFIFSAFWTARATEPGAVGFEAQAGAAQAAVPAPPGGCPGKEGSTQYSGKVETRAIANAVANGKPLSGTWSEPGARSNWHCHPGGQFLVVMEGVGRAQKRGQRMQELKVGEIEYAGPWVEHWHGASAHSPVQYLQIALQPTGTRWQEAVTNDDYLGNDNGFASRAAFLASLK
jgi:mannose-6-phosphate isomerase-like protein (cupin superfamily)